MSAGPDCRFLRISGRNGIKEAVTGINSLTSTRKRSGKDRMFELYDSQLFMHALQKAGLAQEITLSGSVLIPEKVGDERLQAAANKVLEANDALRSYFIEKNGTTYQAYEPYEEHVFEVRHFESAEDMEAWAELYATIPLEYRVEGEGKGPALDAFGKPSSRLALNILRQQRATAKRKRELGLEDREPTCFELVLVQLPETSGAIIKMNHIISDGWSMILVGNQFLHALKGEPFKAYDYRDYVESDKAYKRGERAQLDREFFRDEWLKHPEPTVCFPGKLHSFEGKRNSLVLDAELSEKIRAYCLENRVSGMNVFLAAIGICMRRRLGEDAFHLGSLSINRTGVAEKNTVGLFVSTLPILMEVAPDASFKQLVLDTREKAFSVLRHARGYANPTEVYGNYFDLFVSYRIDSLEADAGAQVREYFPGAFADFAELSVVENPNRGEFTMHFDHNCKVGEEEAMGLLDDVVSIIAAGIEDDSLSVGDVR